ncbi:unnamed protein product [Penicillium camemberti]|uniref:Str. FM013 n=1 Tax=Penicillium camemberti (strain FM 013) TaxID=1429867 RepID=A0A0G4PPB8_PENC3|nr:unnamed protein product [Penicillium camemberti]
MRTHGEHRLARLRKIAGAHQSQLPTTGSGGIANSVSPTSFSGDYFAITDSGSDFVEISKIKNRTAEAVAHLDLSVGPANVAWYS